MLINAASTAWRLAAIRGGVVSRRALVRLGISRCKLRNQLDAARWQMLGQAVVLHSGPLTREQRCRAALINCGPRVALTSVTAAEMYGLRGWECPEVHVLVPVGVRPPRIVDVPVVLHRTRHWDDADLHPTRTHHG
jgi:hypothetical protein